MKPKSAAARSKDIDGDYSLPNHSVKPKSAAARIKDIDGDIPC